MYRHLVNTQPYFSLVFQHHHNVFFLKQSENSERFKSTPLAKIHSSSPFRFPMQVDIELGRMKKSERIKEARGLNLQGMP